MSKQTSVKWLVEQLIPKAFAIYDITTYNAIQQALQMEKEQIEDAWDLSRRDIDYPADGNQYYKQTYTKKNHEKA